MKNELAADRAFARDASLYGSPVRVISPRWPPLTRTQVGVTSR
ncbi:hypothetical protein ACGFOM_38235 [Streptomyces sp. NPDC048594]